jgi:hypothetical protein
MSQTTRTTCVVNVVHFKLDCLAYQVHTLSEMCVQMAERIQGIAGVVGVGTHDTDGQPSEALPKDSHVCFSMGCCAQLQ